MTKWGALVVGACLLVSGCTSSKHLKSPDDLHVTATGGVVDIAGKPANGVAIHLNVAGDTSFKGTNVKTGADGRYQVSMTVPAGGIGEPGQDMVLDMTGADGAKTSVSFTVDRSATVKLPNYQLWNAKPKVTSAHGVLTVTWSQTPVLGVIKYDVGLLDSTGKYIWDQPAAGQRARIDARVLEDRTGDLVVGGREVGGNTIDYRTPPIAVHPTTGAPPSRHAKCSNVSGTSTLTTTPQTVCTLTDGDLTSRAPLVATTGGAVTGVVVDLGKARHIGLVVARGIQDKVVIETSSDGKTYHRAGEASAYDVVASLPSGTVARFVRLRSLTGISETQLTEVSVW